MIDAFTRTLMIITGRLPYWRMRRLVRAAVAAGAPLTVRDLEDLLHAGGDWERAGRLYIERWSSGRPVEWRSLASPNLQERDREIVGAFAVTPMRRTLDQVAPDDPRPIAARCRDGTPVRATLEFDGLLPEECLISAAWAIDHVRADLVERVRARVTTAADVADLEAGAGRHGEALRAALPADAAPFLRVCVRYRVECG